MNISLTSKQALELVTFLKKQNELPLISRQIDSNFKEMEVSELLKLQDQFDSIFTIEFQIECIKCGKNFESVAVKNKTPPIKHSAKCPNCNTKHLWVAK